MASNKNGDLAKVITDAKKVSATSSITSGKFDRTKMIENSR
jgi:hypothetical protein